ncbi:hypothetical protein [Pseudomonas sp. 460]|nr:hypothetical protein [Pseudomonas sp. 460]
MNYVEASGYALCIISLVAGLGAMISGSRLVAFAALVPAIIGGGILLHSM